jgi:two-component system catabolic regulation response regulator CreB
MQRSTILVVEDEPAIAESVAYSLRREGFEVRVAASLEAAIALEPEATLILLDLMLPDGSGFDLIAQLRAQGSQKPIIVLSSRDSEADRVASLETGADDYVTKPFSPREVVARVRAVLRRAEAHAHERPAPASVLIVEPESRRAFHQDKELELTRVEFDLLSQLLQTPGRVFGRAELIDRVWGDGFAITDRTIDSHIKSLRRKVADAGGAPRLIQTVRGVGYRISDGRKGAPEP